MELFFPILLISWLPILVLSVFVLFAIRHARLTQRSLIRRDIELNRKMYELAILKEVGERIGYSLDVAKITDIITGSLRQLFTYSTSASMLLIEEKRIVFKCDVEQSVGRGFVSDVRGRMLAALSALTETNFARWKIEEIVAGAIVDDDNKMPVASFFNIPLVINKKVVGLINISSTEAGLYKEEEMTILYRITQQASDAVSKLQIVLETEKGKVVSLIASMADGVMMTDEDTRIAVINPAAKEMLGLAKENVSIFDVIGCLAGKLDLRAKIEESTRLQKLLIHEDLYIDDKALQVLISPVKDGEGRTLGSVVLFHDITNEKRLERLRQDFTAMMVHELRAPLTALRGTSDTIIHHLAELNGKKLEASVKLLYDSSSQMLSLVNDLLDVAKIEAGKFEVIREAADIHGVVEEAADTFRSVVLEKGLTLQAEVNESVPRQLYFDRLRIFQVLNNLLSNALKFTTVGGVRIGVTVENDEVVVSVSDTGEGMAPEDLPSLFSKFKQLASSRRTLGTGLGLVISKGIVESHGGRIWAQSAVGQGSTFYFSLPIVAPVLQSKVAAEKATSRFTREGKSL